MNIKKITFFLLTILGSIFYRLGGLKGFDTKFRDLGVPTVGLVVMLLLGIKVMWWVHLLSFLLFFAALTSYEYWLDYDNFYLHGFFTSFAYIPYAIATGMWLAFTLRVAIATVSIGLLNYFANKYSWKHSDWIEELGRGGILIATLFLFMPKVVIV